MNHLDFSFEQTPWQIASAALRSGDTLSAVRFLTLLEGEDEEIVEEALQELQERHITLDIRDLPKDSGSGEMAARLRLEERLARQPDIMAGLSDTDPLRLYLEEIAATPAAGDPQLLAERYAAGETEVAAMLVNVSLHQVIEAARNHTLRGVLLLDLIQEGSLGLWQGIMNYTGGDFTAHSRWWIDQAMAHVIVLQARAGGVGQKMLKLLERFREADRQLLTQLGRNPTLEEIALELQISVEDAAVAEQMVQSARVMEQAKKAAQPKQAEEEDNQAVEDTAYFQMRQRILDMLSGLEELDAKLLTLRFGLEGGLPMSPQEVGRKLNLSADEVVNRETAALAKLRQEA